MPNESDPVWMSTAEAELGLAEFPGALHNNRILEYHDTTGLNAEDDETPWCSSFVNWVFKQHGIAGTNSAVARSWLHFGDKLVQPRRGAVVVLWRGSPTSSKGHVGFYDHQAGDRFWLLAGNQNNRVCIDDFPNMKVLDYRWPSGAAGGVDFQSDVRPMLRRGSRGRAVTELQTKLKASFVPFLVVDGIFGRATEEVVRGFQEAKNLTPDGVVGPLTWAALG